MVVPVDRKIQGEALEDYISRTMTQHPPFKAVFDEEVAKLQPQASVFLP